MIICLWKLLFLVTLPDINGIVNKEIKKYWHFHRIPNALHLVIEISLKQPTFRYF